MEPKLAAIVLKYAWGTLTPAAVERRMANACREYAAAVVAEIKAKAESGKRKAETIRPEFEI